ncbi:AfsR/SARP family transcriptional regulator [Actinomadura madurae]|uniref:AfsR/SARP family transcriptional regulator n=1 Tax=Actinomadura madurae TaxID=1993 RepID=UPI0020D22ADF|nr:BTAD domain-containing putative transcriptional regulator [Actinomadura madurae]MCP9982597.1 winged helix-turn-helix domain-containing protein [Actinomadura madurae]
MRFGVLGPLAVWTDQGGLVPVPGLKVRALLADLLVHEGRPVPADRLVDDLWGDAPPGNPMGALSAKVSQLRRVLEDAEPGARTLVESRPAGYLLGADDERVDARRFQDLVGAARRAEEPKEKSALFAEALGLWRGPALADLRDEPFTRAAVTRLEELRLTALEEHAEVRLDLGEHGALAADLGDAVEEHPLRERLRAAHMRALYRAGRQNEALESYERYRTLLADELGLDPGAELADLQRAILRQDPGLDAPAPSRGRSNLPVPPTELIGRDGAVREIRARIGTDRLVTLTGPGGVGKTRLAIETAGGLVDAFADGVWMAELAGFERSTVPDLAEVVTAILDIRDAPGAPEAALDRLAAALGARRAAARPGQLRARGRAGGRAGGAAAAQGAGRAGPRDEPGAARAARRGGVGGPAAGRARRRGRSGRGERGPAVRGPGGGGVAGFPAEQGDGRPGRASCAGGWTASRSRWNWPRPGCGRSGWRGSSGGSTTGSGCCRPGTAAPLPGSGRSPR